MAITIWTFAFLLFVAPGVAFLSAFSLGARLRRSAQTDAFNIAISFFLAALVINVAILAIDLFTGGRNISALAQWMSDAPCSNGNSTCAKRSVDLVEQLLTYGVVSNFAAFGLGFLLSKLVAWGALPFGSYYGPLYPLIKGFFRPAVIVTVVTRICVKATGGSELPIMYRGKFDEMRLTPSGRIEYLSLSPVFGKAVFDPPPLPGSKAAKRAQTIAHELFTEIGVDESAVRDQRLVIEGEEIQNVYFARPSSVWMDEGWRKSVKRTLAAAVRQPSPLVVIPIVAALVIAIAVLLAPSTQH